MRTPLPAWLDRSRFPFEPSLVELGDGEALSVTEVGQGPPVVLSHGTPTWSYEWRHLLAALAPAHRCLAPDHLGFGLSPRPLQADYRPEAHARRFARLVEVLGLERYHLVVHDYGGPFALAAALEHPERVASLTAFNTFCWPFTATARERSMAWLAGTPLFRWAYGALNLSFRIAASAWGDPATVSPQTWPPYLAVFPEPGARRRVLWALAQGLGGSRDFFAGLWERLDRLAGVPVHLVWGLRDTAFPPAALARLQGAFPGASTLALEAAGHWPHEEQPEVCAASVQRFLAGVEARRAA